MSYGVDTADLNRRAATYVDKILKGAKPADVGDDFEVDARGSRRVGVRGIWLNRNGTECPDGSEMITTLTELKTQIGLHNQRLEHYGA